MWEDSGRQNWIERAIQEAQEKGLFDNLEGAGRPINWEDESLVDEDWVMAFRIMREQGFAPEWIELQKEIDQELERAQEAVRRAWRWRQERLPRSRGQRRHTIDAEWHRARDEFAEAIRELNGKISNFNLIVPIARLQKFYVEVDKELAALGMDE
jgi:DnaJ family protein C protein 28